MLFPVPHFPMYPKTHSKRACSMIFPRSAVELSSSGFPRLPFWQMGAVFASHCCGLQVREQPQKGVSELPQHPGMLHICLEGLHGSGTPSAAALLPEPFLSTDLLYTQHSSQPWPTFMDSSFVVHTCFSFPYTALELVCNHKIPVKTRVFPTNLPAFLDCSCTQETLPLLNCQP